MNQMAATKKAPSSATSFRRDINGLRALAISAVVLYHADPLLFAGGQMGVDIFLVLSGFFAATSSSKSSSFVVSLTARLLRIVPTFAAMASATVGAAWLLFDKDSLLQVCNAFAASAIFATNVFYYETTDYFAPSSQLLPLQHLWFLSLEMQLQVCWLLINSAATTLRLDTKATAPFCCCLSAVSFVLFHVQLGVDPSAAFYLPHYRMWEFCIGMLLGMYINYKREQNVPDERLQVQDDQEPSTVTELESPDETTALIWLGTWTAHLSQIGHFVGIMLIAIAMVSRNAAKSLDVYRLVMVVVGTSLILLIETGGGLVGKFLELQILQKLGAWSYAIYIWHWPAFAIRHYTYYARTTAVGQLQLIGPILIVAALCHRFIETPCRSLKMVSLKEKCLAAAMSFGMLLSLFLAAIMGSVQLLANRGETELKMGASAEQAGAAIDLEHARLTKSQPWCKLPLENIQREGITLLEKCTFGQSNSSSAPNVILIGDSHAAHLEGAMRYMAVVCAFRGRIIATTKCLFLPQGVHQLQETQSQKSRNDHFRAHTFAYLKAQPPSVVMLSSFWSSHTLGQRTFGDRSSLGLFLLANQSDAAAQVLTEARSLQVLETALLVTTTRLLSWGHAVLIVGPGPEFDFEPQLAWRKHAKDKMEAMPLVSRTLLAEYLTPVVQVLMKIANTSEKIRYVDLLEAHCDASLCSAAFNGTLWFKDRHHYNQDGSWELGKRLLPIFKPALEDVLKAMQK